MVCLTTSLFVRSCTNKTIVSSTKIAIKKEEAGLAIWPHVLISSIENENIFMSCCYRNATHLQAYLSSAGAETQTQSKRSHWHNFICMLKKILRRLILKPCRDLCIFFFRGRDPTDVVLFSKILTDKKRFSRTSFVFKNTH